MKKIRVDYLFIGLLFPNKIINSFNNPIMNFGYVFVC